MASSAAAAPAPRRRRLVLGLSLVIVEPRRWRRRRRPRPRPSLAASFAAHAPRRSSRRLAISSWLEQVAVDAEPF